jgi:NAD(P)-dependent dehydrogenase (short-subunit alcohol dehydrogenase family)
MTETLENKVAILFGAGSVGPGWGNGKATAAKAAMGLALQYAKDGIRVNAVMPGL